ncbi:MAG: pilus assembly protein [Bdellovibrionales bacterium]|nr:pilus assembly protein [Bdellovibrionales bacterium]
MSKFRDARGATMVEGALVSMLFVLLVLFITDVARYFYSYAVMSYAVSRGADLASKSRVEVYTNQETCPTQPGHNECTDYFERVQQVIDKTLAIANLATSPSDENSGGVRRKSFQHYFESPQQIYDGTSDRPRNWDVAFLRPGEKVKVLENGEEITYPDDLRPFTREDGEFGPRGWPGPGENWGEILADVPLILEMRASFRPITPLLPDLPIKVRSTAFRRTPSKGIGVPAPVPPSEGGGEGSNGHGNGGDDDCACCNDGTPGNCPGGDDAAYCNAQGCEADCDCCSDDEESNCSIDGEEEWIYCMTNRCGE